MNRRKFFGLMAGASVVALAPSLFLRDKPETLTFRFGAINSGPVTMTINGKPMGIVAGELRPGDMITLYPDGDEWRAVVIPKTSLGASFASGGLGGNLVPSRMGLASRLRLSTLTPPLVA